MGDLLKNQTFRRYLSQELASLEGLAEQNEESRVSTLLLFLRTAIECYQEEEIFNLLCHYMDAKLKGNEQEQQQV